MQNIALINFPSEMSTVMWYPEVSTIFQDAVSRPHPFGRVDLSHLATTQIALCINDLGPLQRFSFSL